MVGSLRPVVYTQAASTDTLNIVSHQSKEHFHTQVAARPAGAVEVEYAMEEIEKHNTPDDLWIAVDGDVYDMSKYHKLHPGHGGPAIIIKNVRFPLKTLVVDIPPGSFTIMRSPPDDRAGGRARRWISLIRIWKKTKI